MDFGWGTAAPLSPTGAGTDLNLLNDNLLIDLDDKTLQCLMGGPSTGFAACISGMPGEAATSGSGKRGRQEGEGEITAALEDGEGEGEEDSEEGATGATTRGGRRGKKAKGSASDAATVKAHREKARRERLNECFEELARLCDPSGKMTRTDRISIVQDAIRALGAVRVENNQLRQLNKFLEERVRQLETARAQGMYQQAMMQQQQHQHIMLAQQHPQVQQVQVQQVQQAAAAALHRSESGVHSQQHQQHQQLASAASLGTSLQTQQQQQQHAGAGAGPQGGQEAAAGGGGEAGHDGNGVALSPRERHPGEGQQPAAVQQGAASPSGGQQQGGLGGVAAGMMVMSMDGTGAGGLSSHGAAYGQSFYGVKGEGLEPSLAPSGSGSGALLGMPAGGSGGMAAAAAAAAGGNGYLMPSASTAAADAAGGGGGMLGPAAASTLAPPQVLPANAPPMSWLPAPDISHDQKLRPPAA